MTNTSDSPDPPIDRYCDLVMKGGITSGVVYPAAIDRLSRQYRFKNIGGSSAGAIAAVLTAAAEYQRLHHKSNAGFECLKRLPHDLGQEIPETKTRRLLSLFQPQDGTHRLFAALVHSLNSQTTSSRIGNIVMGLLKAYWPATLGSVLFVLAVGYFFAAWLTALLLGLIAVVVAVGMWIYRDISGAMVKNGFGMCNGMPGNASRTEALTPWLHRLIQEAAGRTGGPPLTFGDLWRAPGTPKDARVERGKEALVLKVLSTNLSHGRPYTFPLNEQERETGAASHFRASERLYFKPDELKPYLPADVHKWMVSRARPYVVEPGREGSDPSFERAEKLGLVELPPPEDFPVLLAARMSLSFPLLFSAIPLWAINHEIGHKPRDFYRCWFSDGGISSNFPMHLFDGLIPRWPTFGITLEPEIAGRDNEPYLPPSYRKGYGERWDLFDVKSPDISRFGGFVSAIVTTMQNWNDATLSRMPGVRDRVVHVHLNKKEGGMNLNMEIDTIDAISQRGAAAAEKLIARFATPAPNREQAEGWDEHRLVRTNVLLKMLEERAPVVVNALSLDCPHATSIDALIDAAGLTAAAGYIRPLNADQLLTLHGLVDAVRAQGEALNNIAGGPHPNPFVALPKPELRVRPPL